MSRVRYHAVVAFGVVRDGDLAPVAEEAASSPQAAILIARRLARNHAGAVAFSRTMDIGRGRYGPATVHVIEGLIPGDLERMFGLRAERKSRETTASPLRIPSALRHPVAERGRVLRTVSLGP